MFFAFEKKIYEHLTFLAFMLYCIGRFRKPELSERRLLLWLQKN